MVNGRVIQGHAHLEHKEGVVIVSLGLVFFSSVGIVPCALT